MTKTLPHRRSFPPTATGAATSGPEHDRDNRHHIRPSRALPAIITSGSYFRSSSPTSHFSDIEEVDSSSPYLALTRPATPPDLRPLTTSVEIKLEPFVSPLTEANLNYHTNSYPPSNHRDVRHQVIKAYVEAQASVLQLEIEMQRRRRAEIRSLVPLDTQSITEEVIQDHPIIDAPITAETATISKKKRRKWSFLRIFQRQKNTKEIPDAPTLTDQQQRHSQPIATSSARSFSWTPGRRTSHYHQETMDIVFQGMLHGLNNHNIARALGCEQVALNLFSRPAAVADQAAVSSSSTPPRRDSGISVLTSKKKKRRSGSLRFAPRLGGVREAVDEQDDRDGGDPVTHQTATPSLPTDRLIGYRYPRMVQRQTLREAAIQVLSSDIAFYSSTPDDLDVNDDFDQYFAPSSSKHFSDPGALTLSQLQRQLS